MTVDTFRALLADTDLFVYERSVDEADGTVAALVRRGLEKAPGRGGGEGGRLRRDRGAGIEALPPDK